MATGSRASFEKTRKERAKKQKRREKLERRLERKTLKPETGEDQIAHAEMYYPPELADSAAHLADTPSEAENNSDAE